MSKPVAIANTFATQPGPIPLSQLDTNFASLQTAFNDMFSYGNFLQDTSGAANLITANTAAGLSFSYLAGMPIQVRLANTNTSTTVNVNINSLGNVLVIDNDGSAPTIGALLAGSILFLMYDGTAFRNIGSVGTGGTTIPFTQVTGVASVGQIPSLPTSQITSGTFANAQISSPSVTQWQSALAIAMSQVSGTLPVGQLPATAYRGTLGSGAVTVQSGGSPSGGANGDIFLIY